MSEPVTDRDRNSVCYFATEKDLTDWVSWEDRKAVILAEYPLLLEALRMKAAYEAMYQAAIDQIAGDITHD